MKRTLILLLAVVLLCGALGSCGSEGNDGLKVVCTVFPIYDWVRQIWRDADLTLLTDKGVDMHSYSPTVADIAAISECDLFIYVGGESDAWVADALAEAKNKDMKVISLLEVLGEKAKREELLEGMEHDEHDGHEGGETEYDEHVWLSFGNAALFCEAVTDALCALLPEHAGEIETNGTIYAATLRDSDNYYRTALAAASGHTLVFGDRYPFRYLAEDYGLTCYAAFPGCSAETEASFETIIFLAGKVDELGLGCVMKTESSNGDIARTITENTRAKNQRILTLDSMQSVSGDLKMKSYLNIMTQNMTTLLEALG